MGFVTDMFSGSSGAGFKAEENGNVLQNLNNQQTQASALESVLLNQSFGGGPNIAGEQLKQATNQNVQNAAGVISSAKGLNPALAARLAGMQAANAGQQAAGQAAVTAGQQQLQSQQNLAGLNLGQQQVMQGGINTVNQANAGVASQNSKGQFGLLNGLGAATGLLPKTAAAATGLAHGGTVPDAMKSGGSVPGHASVPGDSAQNDTVAAKLSPGEIVLPRHITMHPDAPKLAAEFVREELEKHHTKMRHHFASGGGVWDNNMDAVSNSLSSLGDGISSLNSVTPDPDAPQSLQDVARMTASRAQDMAATDQPAPAATPVAAPSPEAPSTPEPTGMPQPASVPSAPNTLSPDMMAGLRGSFGKMKKGIQDEAKAQGELGNKEADILGQSSKDLEAQNTQAQGQFRDLDAERKGLVQKVAEGKIDPNRYLGNMSTGSRVATAIGLILGGMGAGGSGQENLAAKMLQNHIDDDIKAQEKNLGSQENLLSQNLRQFGNLHDAQVMTRANMMDLASLALKKAAAESQDPIAKARATQQAAELDFKASQITGPLQVKQHLLQEASKGGGDPAQLVPLLVPKEHQAKALEEVGRAQNAIKSKKEMLEQFDKAAKDATVIRTIGSLRTPESLNHLDNLMLPLIKDQEGRVNEFEFNTARANRPAPGDTKQKIKEKRQAMIDMWNAKSAAPTAKAFGIDLEKFQSTSGLSPQERQWVEWAKANPNHPTAKLTLKKFGVR